MIGIVSTTERVDLACSLYRFAEAMFYDIEFVSLRKIIRAFSYLLVQITSFISAYPLNNTVHRFLVHCDRCTVSVVQ